MKILVIDNEEDDFLFVKQALEAYTPNAVIERASTFEAGAAALDRRAHDVCILDYRLDNRDALALLMLASDRELPIPVIVLAASDDATTEAKAMSLGAADCLERAELGPRSLGRAIRLAVERSRVIAALRARDRQERTIFRASHDAFLVLGDDGRCLDGNPAAFELFGCTRDTVPNLDVMGLGNATPAESAARWQAFTAGAGLRREVTFEVQPGKNVTLEQTGTASFLPGRHFVVFRDITERRRGEAARERLAAIIESSGEGIESAALDGTIHYWGPGVTRIYGFTEQEMLGRSAAIIVPPDRRGELDRAIARLRAGEKLQSFESTRRRKDGQHFPALLSLSPTLRDGVIVGFSTITRDLTEQKLVEARLIAADRMAAIGVLAASVAHEINNPLTAVLANLDVVGGREDEFSEVDVNEALEHSRIAILRIIDIVRDIKAFARPVDEGREPVELARILDAATRMATSQIGQRARVVREYADVPLVEASASRLEQVFLNLIVNAAQSFLGDSPTNVIRLKLSEVNGEVVAEVSDNGRGIPAENLSRVFEPFFTTKAEGTGTGLGLAISHRIVEDLEGSLSARSEVGAGTSFRVALRAAQRRSVAPAALPAAKPSASARSRILVVDDEPFIGSALTRSLRREHDMSTVGSAEDALALLEKGERFDVLLCDLRMPGMSGMQFYQHVAERYPDVADRVAFFTGGTVSPDAREFMATRHEITLEKPFTNEQIRNFVTKFVADRA